MTAAPLEIRDITSGYGDVPVVRGINMLFPPRLSRRSSAPTARENRPRSRWPPDCCAAWKGSIHADGEDITREPAAPPDLAWHCLCSAGADRRSRDDGARQSHDRRAYSGQRPAAIEAAIERVVQLFPVLKPRMKQHADTMSGGEQQMLGDRTCLDDKPRGHHAGRTVAWIVAEIRRDRVRKASRFARCRHDGGDGRAESLAGAGDLGPRICDASRPGGL